MLQRLLDNDNDENVILFDEDGNEIELEQIAIIAHKDELYAILRPMDAKEDEAVVFKVDPTDEESIHIVEDEKLAAKILELYHNS